jgi:hypothetical protein
MDELAAAIRALASEQKETEQRLELIRHALSALTGGMSRAGTNRPRKMSAAGRRRIAEGQRKRWAKSKRAKK